MLIFINVLNIYQIVYPMAYRRFFCIACMYSRRIQRIVKSLSRYPFALSFQFQWKYIFFHTFHNPPCKITMQMFDEKKTNLFPCLLSFELSDSLRPARVFVLLGNAIEAYIWNKQKINRFYLKIRRRKNLFSLSKLLQSLGRLEHIQDNRCPDQIC